ncbi:hypothetical protein F8388_011205 [Cannabis sativa]|uniref:ATP-dependent Clp protease proteolytic subunit n=1 Tax=Cannabis sativa TaxID=3483 RepID=A0A7J6ERZ3_CANSA|nr:hypothetical protein F8388_011205 [Cannabis sativa]
MAGKIKSKGKKTGPSSSDRVIKTRSMDALIGIQELEIDEDAYEIEDLKQSDEAMEQYLDDVPSPVSEVHPDFSDWLTGANRASQDVRMGKNPSPPILRSNVAPKLKRLKPVLKLINQEGFSDIQKADMIARNDLIAAQAAMTKNPLSLQLMAAEQEANKRYNEVHKAFSMFMSQKAKLNWASYGDENSAFFHASLRSRRIQNKIFSIEDEHGTWFDSPDDVQNAFLSYYEKLLGTSMQNRRKLPWCIIYGVHAMMCYGTKKQWQTTVIVNRVQQESKRRIVGVWPSKAKDEDKNWVLNFIEDDTKDLYLFINSPDGWVILGLVIYDTMQFFQPDVQTICMGLAASMGSFILVGGEITKRLAFPHAWCQ